MHLSRRVVLTVAALGLVAGPAAADGLQLGGWFGGRVFSGDADLGYIADAPAHPKLESSIQLGARLGYQVAPWLTPELELGFVPTKSTRELGAEAASVYWLQPRLQLRFDILPGARLVPFATIGGGAAISLSTARRTFDSGIIGEGYVGGGLRFDTQRGFLLRADARVGFQPGVERFVAAEVEIGVGLELALGGTPAAPTRAAAGPVADRDGDGIPDATDACVDRPEDADGFDDLDGCPDIDNDLDRVLDIADKCPSVPETYNGFRDDDGCPDTLPPEVDALRGTIEGLIYAEGETGVRDSAQASIAKIVATMTQHPTIRVVLIGHTDDREAKQFANAGEPADLATLSTDLSRARADAAKQAFTAAGIASARVDIEGHGAEEPVSDNDKPRGRLANRRVEIRLYVPPSSR